MKSLYGSTCLLVLTAALSALPAAAEPPYEAQVVTGLPHLQPKSMHDCTAVPGNLISNCSFETGDFTGWVANDILSPFLPLQVAGPTYIGYGFFTSAPTQGSVSALHGFDGAGPDTIELGQDVTLPGSSTVSLEFDYRGAWDLASFGATQDRLFDVQVEPSGGGAPLQTDAIFTATSGTLVTDTGPQSAMVDLSAFSGQSVRVNFVFTVPETFSGPGFIDLDNVLLLAQPLSLLEIPTAGTVGLTLLAMLLAAGGLLFLRRVL